MSNLRAKLVFCKPNDLKIKIAVSFKTLNKHK